MSSSENSFMPKPLSPQERSSSQALQTEPATHPDSTAAATAFLGRSPKLLRIASASTAAARTTSSSTAITLLGSMPLTVITAATTFLGILKDSLRNEPEILRLYLEILDDHEKQKINGTEMIDRVSILFEKYPLVHTEFKEFLSAENKYQEQDPPPPSLPSPPSPPPAPLNSISRIRGMGSIHNRARSNSIVTPFLHPTASTAVRIIVLTKLSQGLRDF